MIVNRLYNIDDNGKRLHYILDALTDNVGNVLIATNGSPIPSGNYIMQEDTGISYEIAFDYEDKMHPYVATDVPMTEEARISICKQLGIDVENIDL